MTCTTDEQLDDVDAGSEAYLGVTFTATPDEPAAASSAVAFIVRQPNGVLLSATDTDPEVTGPTAGTTVVVDDDGASHTVTTTRWVYKTPVLTQSGRHDVAAASTAGIIRTERSWFRVPSYSPFATP